MGRVRWSVWVLWNPISKETPCRLAYITHVLVSRVGVVRYGIKSATTRANIGLEWVGRSVGVVINADGGRSHTHGRRLLCGLPTGVRKPVDQVPTDGLQKRENTVGCNKDVDQLRPPP